MQIYLSRVNIFHFRVCFGMPFAVVFHDNDICWEMSLRVLHLINMKKQYVLCSGTIICNVDFITPLKTLYSNVLLMAFFAFLRHVLRFTATTSWTRQQQLLRCSHWFKWDLKLPDRIKTWEIFLSRL